MEKLYHVIEAPQFTREWLEKELFPLVREMKVVAKYGSDALSNKEMITLFYEPSTRTRISFEVAMCRLGGIVASSTENAAVFSSAVKGETLEDTIRVLNEYGPDVIVLRHFEEGSARIAAAHSRAAVINAGDGAGQHPTQALLDLFTIQEEVGMLDNISVAFVGDLAKGRTVRSLVYLLGKFSGVRVWFVSPQSLKIGEDMKDYLKEHKIPYVESSDLREVVPEVDVIYQTRIQKERGSVFDPNEDRGSFVVNREILHGMRSKAIIMHPLPRNDEIEKDVDSDPRAAYFRQAGNGLFVRMALLYMILA